MYCTVWCGGHPLFTRCSLFIGYQACNTSGSSREGSGQECRTWPFVQNSKHIRTSWSQVVSDKRSSTVSALKLLSSHPFKDWKPDVIFFCLLLITVWCLTCVFTSRSLHCAECRHPWHVAMSQVLQFWAIWLLGSHVDFILGDHLFGLVLQYFASDSVLFLEYGNRMLILWTKQLIPRLNVCNNYTNNSLCKDWHFVQQVLHTNKHAS